MTNMKIRKLPLIIISILMISTALFSATSLRPVSAQGTAVLLVDPQTASIYAQPTGTQFDVNISIANITGLAGLSFDFAWDNPALLKANSITEVLYHTLTPSASWSNIWNLGLKFNNTAGTASYAQTWQDMGAAQADGYSPANITGKMATATLTFNVTQVPAAGSYVDVNLTLANVKAGDLDGVAIPISSQNTTYRIYGPPIINTKVTPITWNGNTYNVTTVSNETVVDGTVAFVGGPPTWSLSFNVTGTDGDTAYVNVTIPMGLMIGPFNVTVNGVAVTPQITSDETNTYVYITAQLSEEPVTIIGTIPEFTLLFIPLLMATTLIAYALRRRRRL